MSSRVSFAPSILGKLAAFANRFGPEARRRSSSPHRVDSADRRLADAVKSQPKRVEVSINHLPGPSELPMPGLDETGY